MNLNKLNVYNSDYLIRSIFRTLKRLSSTYMSKLSLSSANLSINEHLKLEITAFKS